MQKQRSLFATWAFILVLGFVSASDANASWWRGWADPVGTWNITVSFPAVPGAPPPFKELIAFHRGGTVSETNSSLHANSANPAVPQFNFTGSDGYGTWSRINRNTFYFSFVKIVFDGTTNQQAGYLRVSSRFRIENGKFIQDAADSLTELLIGPDLDAPLQVVPFGGADAEGTRIN
ncbi:MAG: hypothetical protein AAFZ58_15200 [Pseudomonadota bacterium]